jgi:hypothetical protein
VPAEGCAGALRKAFNRQERKGRKEGQKKFLAMFAAVLRELCF